MSPSASRRGFPSALPVASLILPVRFFVVPSISSWVPDLVSNDGSFFIVTQHRPRAEQCVWGVSRGPIGPSSAIPGNKPRPAALYQPTPRCPPFERNPARSEIWAQVASPQPGLLHCRAPSVPDPGEAAHAGEPDRGPEVRIAGRLR